jgi:hypothetical protein
VERVHSPPANIIPFSYTAMIFALVGVSPRGPLVERGNRAGPVMEGKCDLEQAFSYRTELSFLCVNHARKRQFSKEKSADED